MFLTQQSLYDKRASATKTKMNISHAPQPSDSSFDYTESPVKRQELKEAVFITLRPSLR